MRYEQQLYFFVHMHKTIQENMSYTTSNRKSIITIIYLKIPFDSAFMTMKEKVFFKAIFPKYSIRRLNLIFC